MKVRFKLKKDTLEMAAAVRAMQSSPDAVVQADYFIDAQAQDEAFDKAAIEFAKDWLTVEYADE